MIKFAESQRSLWNEQHVRRRKEHKDIANIPNVFAVKCLGYLPEGAKVLELGAASGRDARYFSREKNCQVLALDFSLPALQHLKEDSVEDGSVDFIEPINADIKHIPLRGKDMLDAVYARSSLHVNDRELEKILGQLVQMLKSGGYLMIEGKTLVDPKIKASRLVADNLVLDKEGHLRRVWDKGYVLRNVIKKFDLRLILMQQTSGKQLDKDSNYLNFIAQKYED